MQKKNSVSNEYADGYNRWFETHPEIYVAQLALLRHHIPRGDRILEVSAGSGRFTAPPGIPYGLDLSPTLLAMVRQRGIETGGFGSSCRAGTFDGVLMMSVICFFEDLDRLPGSVPGDPAGWDNGYRFFRERQEDRSAEIAPKTGRTVPPVCNVPVHQ